VRGEATRDLGPAVWRPPSRRRLSPSRGVGGAEPSAGPPIGHDLAPARPPRRRAPSGSATCGTVRHDQVHAGCNTSRIPRPRPATTGSGSRVRAPRWRHPRWAGCVADHVRGRVPIRPGRSLKPGLTPAPSQHRLAGAGWARRTTPPSACFARARHVSPLPVPGACRLAREVRRVPTPTARPSKALTPSPTARGATATPGATTAPGCLLCLFRLTPKRPAPILSDMVVFDGCRRRCADQDGAAPDRLRRHRSDGDVRWSRRCGGWWHRRFWSERGAGSRS